jgi:hypothetical protein
MTPTIEEMRKMVQESSGETELGAPFCHECDTINGHDKRCVIGALASALEQLEEMEASFNLYDSAIRRGTEKWFDAHPMKHRVWPDAGDLIGWLLQSGLIALADEPPMPEVKQPTPQPPAPEPQVVVRSWPPD